MNGIKLGQIEVGKRVSDGSRQVPGDAVDLSQEVGLPKAIPLDEPPLPSHSPESVKRKFPSCRIGQTFMNVEVSETVKSAPGSAGDQGHGIVTARLTGPSSAKPKLSLLKPPTWRNSPDNSISIQLVVGSDSCPDWGHATVCLDAMKMALQLEDGFLTPELRDALKQNLPVVNAGTRSLAV